MIRMPRLEALMDVPTVDDATEVALQRLVSGGVREDVDLEFKQSLYGASEAEKRELGKDVAALANSRGGTLIVGVRSEDEIAVELTPVEPGHELRLQQTLVSQIAPVPQVEVRPIEASAGGCYYLLAVPASPGAPHAVRVNDALRYPRREGAHTRYLAESEVADAYRSRFTDARHQIERLDQVHEEGATSLPLGAPAVPGGNETWMVMGLVPNTPGNVPMGRRALDRVYAFLDQRQESAIPYTWLDQATMQSPVPGYRRFVWSDTALTRERTATARHVELHTDGAGFAASVVSYTDSNDDAVIVSDEMLICELAVAMHVLGSYAGEVAGAAGDAAVSAGVLVLSPQTRLSNRRNWLSRVAQPAAATVPLSTRTVALDDLVTWGAPLLIATRLFASDVLSGFGVAETQQIDPDGRLILSGFSGDWQQALGPWATDHGIEVV